jgi:hypothetical protein
MSSIERAETLLRLLDLDDAFRASRPNGYAYARIVDVEHAADMPPDTLVLAIDPLARLERAYPESPRRRQDRQQPFRRNTRQTGSIQSGSDRPGQPLVRAESGPYLPTHRISGSLHRPGAGKGGIVGMSGSSPGTRQTTKGALGPPLHPAGEGRHGQVGQAPFSFAPRRRSAPAPTVGWSSNPAQILGQRFAPQEVRRSPSLHDRAGSPPRTASPPPTIDTYRVPDQELPRQMDMAHLGCGRIFESANCPALWSNSAANFDGQGDDGSHPRDWTQTWTSASRSCLDSNAVHHFKSRPRVAEPGSFDVKGAPFGRARRAACSLRAIPPAVVLARAARPR